MGNDLNEIKIDENTSALAPNLTGVDFWRAQYTKRRIYIEKRSEYEKILETINTLKLTFQTTLEQHPLISHTLPDHMAYALLTAFGKCRNVLQVFQESSLKTPSENPEILQDKFEYAYKLSSEYGYLITQMGLQQSSELLEQHELIEIFNRLHKDFWRKNITSTSRLTDTNRKDIPSDRTLGIENDNIIPFTFVNEDGFKPIGFVKARVESNYHKNNNLISFDIPNDTYIRLTPANLIKSIQMPFLEQQLHAFANELQQLRLLIFKLLSSHFSSECELHLSQNSPHSSCSFKIEHPSWPLDKVEIFCSYKEQQYPTNKNTQCSTLPSYFLACFHIFNQFQDAFAEKNLKIEDIKDLSREMNFIITTDHFFKAMPAKMTDIATFIAKNDNCLEIMSRCYSIVKKQTSLHKILKKRQISLARSSGEETRALALIVWDMKEIYKIEDLEEITSKINKIREYNIGFSNKKNKGLKTLNDQLVNIHYPTTDHCIKDDFIYPLRTKSKIS